MSHVAISLLGPFHVTRDGKPISHFATDTARALLAYLAMHSQAPCRRETLAGLLWPDEPEPDALRNLRQALSRLRQAIGDSAAHPTFLIGTPQTLQLNPDSDYWLDVAAFADAMSSTRRHAHRRLERCASCIGRLQEAVEWYRGDFLAEFSLSSVPLEEWLVVQREGLHHQALEALHCLAAHHEGQAEYEQALRYARRQIELEPWREVAHRQAMRALALGEQRDAALAQYETCLRVLAEELGVHPEAETTVLCQRIRDDEELQAGLAVPPHNLPAALTPFVGRERELAQIEECLQDPACRLLTLVGLGGIGKTRLALEAAMEQVNAFEHGVFFVPLASV